jgi:integration host factor subunit alpha
MTKSDLIDAVCEKVGWASKKEAGEVVEAVIAALKETLGQGESIKISGFGNFLVRDKKQRMGRNPQSGSPILISARRVLTFKASEILKKVLNDPA